MTTTTVIKEPIKLKNLGLRSYQIVLAITLALMASFLATPAQAGDSTILLCTKLPAPTVTSMTVPTDPLTKNLQSGFGRVS